jgi:hypothetical protein
METAGVAFAKHIIDQNLGFIGIVFRPIHPHAQRIDLRP